MCKVILTKKNGYVLKSGRRAGEFCCRCRTCNDQMNHASKKANPHWEKTSRDNRRFQKYGISGVDFDKQVEAQGGRCEICKSVFNLKDRNLRPCVDHCHATGCNRGILCSQCNVVLGHSKDSPEILKAAIEYLKKFQIKVVEKTTNH